jgi:hypothetical protein
MSQSKNNEGTKTCHIVVIITDLTLLGPKFLHQASRRSSCFSATFPQYFLSVAHFRDDIDERNIIIIQIKNNNERRREPIHIPMNPHTYFGLSSEWIFLSPDPLQVYDKKCWHPHLG